jgi:Dolichyl-phosphate-mannose-protein mannosyltransferase
LNRLPRLGFNGALAAIAAAAFVVRVVYVFVAVRHGHLGLDSASYRELALNLRDGHGYAGLSGTGVLAPRATFPPGFPAYLAVSSVVVGRTVLGLRVATAALGAVSVVLIGVLGRRLAGPRIGLVAAGLAVFYLPLVTTDGSLMAEPLYLVLVLVAVIASVLLHERPTVVGAVFLGVSIGLAALTRSEGLLLVPFVAGPAVVLSHASPLTVARRAALIVIVAIGVVGVLVPWHIRNARTFEQPVWFSGNSASVVAGTACDRHFEGSETGWWTFDCLALRGLPQVTEPSDVYAALRRQALEYTRAHLSALPRVELVRELRAWGMWAPRQQASPTFEAGESRVEGWQLAAWACYVVILLLAVVGFVVARRRRIARWPLLGLVLMVLTSVALTYGNQRFRIAAEPALLVFAAIGVTWAGQRTGRSRTRRGRSVPELADTVADAPPRNERELLEDHGT